MSWDVELQRKSRICFAHCGFNIPNNADSENDVIFEMYHIANYEKFSRIDSSLQCLWKWRLWGSNCWQTAAKHLKTSEDRETDEDDRTERERVADQDAKQPAAGLQFHFMQEDNERSPALETCPHFVQLQSSGRTRQGTLDQLLQRH
jgi:hypothetical protein